MQFGREEVTISCWETPQGNSTATCQDLQFWGCLLSALPPHREYAGMLHHQHGIPRAPLVPPPATTLHCDPCPPTCILLPMSEPETAMTYSPSALCLASQW